MISIVMPVLDEAAAVEQALVRLAGCGAEVLVVDGGSSDGSRELAARHARVLCCEPGRARQMNVGARAARGDLLLFLHVDTVLAPGALAAVERAMASPEVVGGGFAKRYDSAHPALKVLAWLLNVVRSRLLGNLVGTQAIFLRRELFERLGGYRELPLLEDVELSDRLKRCGRVCVIEPPVLVSARRYRKRGVLRQTGVNLLVLVAYRLGLAPERLARLYRGLSR